MCHISEVINKRWVGISGGGWRNYVKSKIVLL